MATVKYDAVATIKYTQNGEEKKRYHKMGVVFDGAKGMSIKIESMPVGWDGWISLYEPKPKENQGGARQQKNAPISGDAEGEIPF